MTDKLTHKNNAERAREQVAQDWEWLMSDPRGRRIVHRDLLAPAQLDETLFNGNSRDAFIEGRRSVSREVLHRAREPFDDYLTMLKEHNNG